MKKIKILFYAHQVDFAGTWRSHERILLNLDSDKFDVYVFYNPDQINNRLDYVISKLGESRVIPFKASKEKLGAEVGYPYKDNNFSELAKSMNFDIIHFARSGYFEFPFIERIAPVQIETNIFGYKDNTKYLDYSVTICDTITNRRGGCDYMVYNPIPQKIDGDENLRQELNIPLDYVVFGRIGRKDNFTSIAFESLKRLKDSGFNKFKYIIIGACEHSKRCIQQLGLNENCIILETTSDDNFIHKFHNTIDIFAHYRSDGECHSTALSQALMYGIPVISHYGGFNGQSETIRDGGFVAKNSDEYFKYILRLINDKNFYNYISENAKNRAMDFEERKIVKEWEDIYVNVLEKTNR